MRKILTILMSVMCLGAVAQSGYFFDMDELVASEGLYLPQNKPWLVGVAPCTGFGLYDLDMVLPVEVRFGKFITDRWYILGELTYHASLANETATIEPAIRVGYNFGRKLR